MLHRGLLKLAHTQYGSQKYLEEDKILKKESSPLSPHVDHEGKSSFVPRPRNDYVEVLKKFKGLTNYIYKSILLSREYDDKFAYMDGI